MYSKQLSIKKKKSRNDHDGDMHDMLVLVDANDHPWGKLEKSLVHELGLLHRAFSIFIFNTNGELLLQQRADRKYHSAGLWTNTCCSHPRYGEDLTEAVGRRLWEEMGMVCQLDHAFHFTYRANFDNGLTEHELDHVFIGISDERPRPYAAEVKSWKYAHPAKLLGDMKQRPGDYTAWFGLALHRILQSGFVTRVE